MRSARRFLPEARFAAIEEGRRLQQAITPRLRARLSERERQLLDRALSEASLTPLRPEDLPPSVVAGLREHDGRIDRNILVFPRIGGGTWQADKLEAYARDLREAAALGNGQVAGSPLLSSDIAAAMKADGPRMTLLSFACVVVICCLAFAGTGASGFVFAGFSITSLLLGVVFMLGILAWTGHKLNFSNFVALPITFGIAADYSINMLRRFQTSGSFDRDVSRTSAALARCSSTTIIGYGSLLMAQNRALYSFGVFAITGELMSLCAALLAIPAPVGWAIGFSESHRSNPRGRVPTALG